MISSNFRQNFCFSNPNFLKASDEEDRKYGIDFWLCNIPVAFRKRRIKCPGDISIRYQITSGPKTEYYKILSGVYKAKLFIFEFEDKVIFAKVESIKKALLNHRFQVIPNKDGKTKGAYIKLENIKFLEWKKEL